MPACAVWGEEFSQLGAGIDYYAVAVPLAPKTAAEQKKQPLGTRWLGRPTSYLGDGAERQRARERSLARGMNLL